MEMLSLVPLAPRIFDLFDDNRDGSVDMREIIAGFSTLKYSQGDDALRLCFQMYDTDRSGCISKEELASLLKVSLTIHSLFLSCHSHPFCLSRLCPTSTFPLISQSPGS